MRCVRRPSHGTYWLLSVAQRGVLGLVRGLLGVLASTRDGRRRGLIAIAFGCLKDAQSSCVTSNDGDLSDVQVRFTALHVCPVYGALSCGESSIETASEALLTVEGFDFSNYDVDAVQHLAEYIATVHRISYTRISAVSA